MVYETGSSMLKLNFLKNNRRPPPGAALSSGFLARLRTAGWMPNLPAGLGWIPALPPAKKNFSTPARQKLSIVRAV
jgi:hypothetical protein